jgi:hypothetical protein
MVNADWYGGVWDCVYDIEAVPAYDYFQAPGAYLREKRTR